MALPADEGGAETAGDGAAHGTGDSTARGRVRRSRGVRYDGAAMDSVAILGLPRERRQASISGHTPGEASSRASTEAKQSARHLFFSMKSPSTVRSDGPFSMFMSSFKSHYASTSDEYVLSGFLSWRKQPDAVRLKYRELYYSNFIRRPTMKFKPRYIARNDASQRVPVHPYFLWLAWYLRYVASEEATQHADPKELAIRLGMQWNLLDTKTRLAWARLAHREFRGRRTTTWRTRYATENFQ